MKFVVNFLLIILITCNVYARELGQTEITAEDGIEVYQDEKYYLLKKNVKIESDDLNLIGDTIKIYFDEDLYDIKKIDANGNVNIISKTNDINANGTKVVFYTNKEEIFIDGLGSKLTTKNITMISDGFINVKNLVGEFILNGTNSKITTENITIEGNLIEGFFNSESNLNDIKNIKVTDEKLAYVKSNDTEMYANLIKYNKETSLIELEDNVKIIDGSETITGDYAEINTETNSYKINSSNSKSVKVIISNNNE
ncbi:hypothetical protein OAZ90_00260 [Pelagibacteraceae bacterium]|nr:hypothetical protein [Pelagibacteraceae bacterium]